VGAFGGKAEIMDMIAPAGSVYQAGTFSGNPLAMAAGVTTLHILENPLVWENFEKRANQLKEGVRSILKKSGKPYQLQSVGTMFTLFFTDQPVINWSTANRSDREEYAAFFRKMLNYGVYLAPSQFESGFLSTMHSEHDILITLEAIERALI
jgi:glutamate-1-semialdehyde 2,1-aminomutase